MYHTTKGVQIVCKYILQKDASLDACYFVTSLINGEQEIILLIHIIEHHVKVYSKC